MSRIAIGLLSLNLSLLSSVILAEPTSIVAATSERLPFDGVDELTNNDISLEVFNLDSVDSIERELSRGLPADEAQAKKLIQRRIADIGQEKLNQDIREAYLPLSTMVSYGLDRYPVIVFDQEYVIYGVTNLPIALGHYREWQREYRKGEGNE